MGAGSMIFEPAIQDNCSLGQLSLGQLSQLDYYTPWIKKHISHIWLHCNIEIYKIQTMQTI